ncbi:MAG TPA: hypothetical protein VN851_29180, partial [Thermoanaerobaculia bacterium]|nr:hypothetical protein [Thermoanaerobaculia bacterium]
MRSRSNPSASVALLWMCLAVAAPAAAQVAREPGGPFGALVRADESLNPREALTPLTDVRASLLPGVDGAWNDLVLDQGDWNAFVDSRNGRIESAEGTGIPWIPGTGNRLRKEDLGLAGKDVVGLEVLERIARTFIV